ncbi:ABC transporter ATP-binding protein [Candidatus Bathyarchaeota archaeon CG07_land_8_20_14_0_80_47_9]|jgi:molybdopterin-binding protein|nr:MAG: ABC transporter ATP-binding protein [Candidatus Bathyarchaeota archaeon CG07_land_8_20_14_0_80_47_9]
MTLIAELKNVTKAFDDKTVLEDINLKINQGEALAFLGPNGSGKTTLLKILAFIEKPTKGEVHFDGRRVANKNLEQMRLESTMVFQKTVLFSTSVYNNVAYGLRIRKTPKSKIDEEISKALKLVRLEGFEKRQAKKLSGGEQQRVALARALVLNTKLLLLDEPTANLDPKNASIAEEAIAAANRELKTTIVIATHNMFQAKNLPNRIALMDNGRISEAGTPAEIFGKLSKTLASFAAVENTFRGTAKMTKEGTTSIDIGNGVQLTATAPNTGEVSIFVSPEDIILSKNRLESSARNVLRGNVTEIQDLGPVVRLRIDVGKPFIVQITKSSFHDMRITLNSEVYLAFKASSVQII